MYLTLHADGVMMTHTGVEYLSPLELFLDKQAFGSRRMQLLAGDPARSVWYHAQPGEVAGAMSLKSLSDALKPPADPAPALSVVADNVGRGGGAAVQLGVEHADRPPESTRSLAHIELGVQSPRRSMRNPLAHTPRERSSRNSGPSQWGGGGVGFDVGSDSSDGESNTPSYSRQAREAGARTGQEFSKEGGAGAPRVRHSLAEFGRRASARSSGNPGGDADAGAAPGRPKQRTRSTKLSANRVTNKLGELLARRSSAWPTSPHALAPLVSGLVLGAQARFKHFDKTVQGTAAFAGYLGWEGSSQFTYTAEVAVIDGRDSQTGVHIANAQVDLVTAGGARIVSGVTDTHGECTLVVRDASAALEALLGTQWRGETFMVQASYTSPDTGVTLSGSSGVMVREDFDTVDALIVLTEG